MASRGNLRFLFAVAAIFVLIFANQSAFAAIVVENPTGTLTITTPTGSVTTVEPGGALPEIPTGSTLEPVVGCFECLTSEEDVLNVLVNGSTAVVRRAKIRGCVELRTGNGKMEVVDGSVQVTQPDGTIQTIGQGSQFSAPAPAPIALETVDIPGTNPAENTGRQGDAEQGLVSGY